MHPSIFTNWIFALTIAGLAACGAEGPSATEETSSSAGGSPATDGDGATDESGGANSSPPDDDGPSSGSSSGSTSSGAGGSEVDPDDAPTCSIMSSNVSCKSCLEENCCMVVHACLDEDLLGCVSCLDCFLSGDGPDCCDESVGKNDWLAECIAFNCQDAC